MIRIAFKYRRGCLEAKDLDCVLDLLLYYKAENVVCHLLAFVFVMDVQVECIGGSVLLYMCVIQTDAHIVITFASL